MSWLERQLVNFLPAGEIKAYAGATAPKYHLLCDGSAVSRTTYARLYRAIGTTYGVGDGSTTFNVPDLQDRLPFGKGTTLGTLAATGGSVAPTLPAHYHGKGDLNITTGGSHGHNCMTPGGGSSSRLVNDSLGAGTVFVGDYFIPAASHTHPSSEFSGNVGATGGVSGDSGLAAMSLPAYQVVNYIIRY